MPPRTRMFSCERGWKSQNENERDSSTWANPRGKGHVRGRGRGCGGRDATHDVPN